jgi:hypothetical protein
MARRISARARNYFLFCWRLREENKPKKVPRKNEAIVLVETWMRAILANMNRHVSAEVRALRRMGKRARRTWIKPHQGKREIARRRSQIERGILQVSPINQRAVPERMAEERAPGIAREVVA